MEPAIDKIYRNANEPFVTFVDQRDHLLGPSESLPFIVDLSEFDSPVTTQTVGSCTADAVTNLYENLLNQKGKEYMIDLSRLFLYHCSRRYLGLQNVDSGSSIRMSVRALANIGVCPEWDMPYEVAEHLFTPPNDEMVKEAEIYKIEEYFSVRNSTEVMSALAQNKPVAFAIMYQGGPHAMLAVGYDRDAQVFKCKNSWGNSYGENGYVKVTFDEMDAMFEAFTFSLPDEEMDAPRKLSFLQKLEKGYASFCASLKNFWTNLFLF